VTPIYDVIIVGSGPAGVSAAFPLVERGLQVLMLDGGRESSALYPPQEYLSARATDAEQWRWMVGSDFYALQQQNAVSPKLRVPAYREVFSNYAEENRIIAKNFVVAGSLATGGLSNAWGCGVAKLSTAELAEYPCATHEMEEAYAAVARRIGISGRHEDDLSAYFGVDEWAQPPITMDALNTQLLRRYAGKRNTLHSLGVRLGRSRVAVLSQDYNARRACNLSGNCLWGCSQQALYSASHEVTALQKHGNFTIQKGFIVKAILKQGEEWLVAGKIATGDFYHRARCIVLAAGTLATTRLVLQALNHHEPKRLLSCPTAAFLLWLPSQLGAARKASFGLGQLSMALQMNEGVAGFGSTFSASGIPISEFVRHVPLIRRSGINLLKGLLSSCLVGNLFLNGSFSNNEVQLSQSGDLEIRGDYHKSILQKAMTEASSVLRRAFLHLGGIILPGSFQQGAPGSDIHYAGTLPMRLTPRPGETSSVGAVSGLPGVYVVDGACLPSLPEKSHTLTIMANAHRIGHELNARYNSKITNDRL
jgi:choline dehydrogenase-like flavoprotein